MVDGGGSSEFPVTLFEGEKEISIGNVKINPMMDYKSFKLMLSHKVGISPNQISIYLIDGKKSAKSPATDYRRRIPITVKVNFGLICRQENCGFLVVLKRSRKSRVRRERIVNGDYDLMMLRRDQTAPFFDQITDLNDRLQSSRIFTENYHEVIMANRIDDPYYTGVDLNQYDLYYSAVATTTTTKMMMMMKKVYCEECVNAEKDAETTSFHLCVNDAVINWFATRAGPIDRPNEKLNSLTDLGFFLEDV